MHKLRAIGKHGRGVCRTRHVAAPVKHISAIVNMVAGQEATLWRQPTVPCLPDPKERPRGSRRVLRCKDTHREPKPLPQQQTCASSPVTDICPAGRRLSWPICPNQCIPISKQCPQPQTPTHAQQRRTLYPLDKSTSGRRAHLGQDRRSSLQNVRPHHDGHARGRRRHVVQPREDNRLVGRRGGRSRRRKQDEDGEQPQK